MQKRLLHIVLGVVVELTILGLFLERIGRYRVIDMLQAMEDKIGNDRSQ
jgi:hypothetical protein